MIIRPWAPQITSPHHYRLFQMSRHLARQQKRLSEMISPLIGEGGAGAPSVAVPVGDVSFPRPGHNNTRCCLCSRGCGFPVRPDWRDPDEPGQHVSFNRQCRSALSGVLFFLMQTPSVASSGPLSRSTSVFSNDSVTPLAHIRAGPSPPHLAAIFFLNASVHLTATNSHVECRNQPFEFELRQ